MKGWRTVAAVALGMAVAGMAWAGSAAAHTREFPSTVSLALGTVNGGQDSAWYGYVDSPRESCIGKRRVNVFWRTGSGPDVLIGFDRTSPVGDPLGGGAYTVYQDGYPPPDGVYYSRVLRKVVKRTEKHKHVCGADRSNEWAIATNP